MKPEHRWPIGITIILVGFAAANLAMMRVARNDPAFAVEPDYYRKAVGFDSTMAQERRSIALGWVATSRIELVDHASTVTVVLRDSAGNAVHGAIVSVHARFNARANDVLTATLTEQQAGVYRAPLAATHDGEWEVRVDAARGRDRFEAATRTHAQLGK